MKRFLFLSLVIVISACSVYAMLISAHVRIKGRVLAVYTEPQLNEDEAEMNENLRTSYVMKIAVEEIYYENSHDAWRIERFLEHHNEIPITEWSLKIPGGYKEEDLKEGAIFMGFLSYASMENHQYAGYKTKWRLEIDKIF